MRSQRALLACGFTALLLVFIAPRVQAQGEIDVTRIIFRGSAEATPRSDEIADAEQFGEFSDFPVSRTFQQSASGDGNSASASASVDAQLSQDSGTGQVAGDFQFTGAAAANTDRVGFGALAIAELHLDFTVTGESATISLSGNMDAACAGSDRGTPMDAIVQASVFRSTEPSGIEFREAAQLETQGDGPVNGNQAQFTLAFNSALEPGDYRLSLTILCRATYTSNSVNLEAAGNSSANLNAQFSISPETNEFFWEVADGSFDDERNWDPEEVPGPDGTAIFDINQPITVAFAEAGSDQASIRSGIVSFLEGAYTLAATSLDGPGRSIRVGDNPGEAAVLSIEEHALTTVHSAIGQAGGSVGTVLLEDSLARWNNTGRLSVGLNGTGVLRISEGAQVASAESRIGDGDGSTGTVEVLWDQSTTEGQTHWDAANLAVGFDGGGTLNIQGGAVSAQDLIIGGDSVGEGIVTVNGADGPASLDAGFIQIGGEQAFGSLSITNGGSVQTVFDLRVADSSRESDNISQLIVLGRSAARGIQSTLEAVSGDVAIGFRGRGILELDDGALIRSENGFVGTEAGGEGVAFIEDATWAVSGEFRVGEAESFLLEDVLAFGKVHMDGDAEINAQDITIDAFSEILGNGTLVADDVLNFHGILEPDVLLTGKQSPVDEAQATAGAILTIEGNLESEGGQIRFDLAGPDTGAFDQIIITGDAIIREPTIHLNFIDGYLPSVGDTAPLITADGTLSLENPTLEFAGAPDGFDYQLDVRDGEIVFQAIADGGGKVNGLGCGGTARRHGRSAFAADALLIFIVLALLALSGGSRLCFHPTHRNQERSR